MECRFIHILVLWEDDGHLNAWKDNLDKACIENLAAFGSEREAQKALEEANAWLVKCPSLPDECVGGKYAAFKSTQLDPWIAARPLALQGIKDESVWTCAISFTVERISVLGSLYKWLPSA